MKSRLLNYVEMPVKRFVERFPRLASALPDFVRSDSRYTVRITKGGKVSVTMKLSATSV